MARQGQIVDRTASGGRSVWEAWCELFEANEKAWNAGDVQKIRTDPELIAKMREWFPRRRGRLMSMPSRQRGAYNRKRKHTVVFRYIRDSTGQVCRTTATGMPLTPFKPPKGKPKRPY